MGVGVKPKASALNLSSKAGSAGWRVEVSRKMLIMIKTPDRRKMF